MYRVFIGSFQFGFLDQIAQPRASPLYVDRTKSPSHVLKTEPKKYIFSVCMHHILQKVRVEHWLYMSLKKYEYE
jgi:hypothetical protein